MATAPEVVIVVLAAEVVVVARGVVVVARGVGLVLVTVASPERYTVHVRSVQQPLSPVSTISTHMKGEGHHPPPWQH